MLLKKFGIGFFENMPLAAKTGLIASFLLLLTVNIVMLDLVIFFGRTVRPIEVAVSTVRVTATPTPAESCPSLCEAKIDTLTRRIDDLPVLETLEGISSVPQIIRSVKENYISLGSGTAKNNTWEDIGGAEAVIDTANYPSITSVTFEVFLKIPTANGKVFAKLYNVTDKHDVWFSEVNSEGPALTKKEAIITLDSGAKTYRVMGLSTLKYDANIENARIRIVTY